MALAHLAFQWARYGLGLPEFYGFFPLIDMGVEANLPTFFSSVQLLVVSMLLIVVGLAMRQRRDSYARHWLFLALIFFLMAYSFYAIVRLCPACMVVWTIMWPLLWFQVVRAVQERYLPVGEGVRRAVVGNRGIVLVIGYVVAVGWLLAAVGPDLFQSFGL